MFGIAPIDWLKSPYWLKPAIALVVMLASMITALFYLRLLRDRTEAST